MKKAVKPRGGEETFQIRFAGTGIGPEAIPPRVLYDALSAIQDLANRRDSFELAHVPLEKTIGLVDVRRGSAVYGCVARDRQEATSNLMRVGADLRTLLEKTDTKKAGEESDGDEMVAMLAPIEMLSNIAKATGCPIEILVAGRKSPLFTIEEDLYGEISRNLLMTGETTVTGTVQRVGGATATRCLLRVPGRRRLLYCNIVNQELAKRLGQHLYERIVARGTATWIHRNWRIVRFTISDFTQPAFTDSAKAIEAIRAAGLDAWDQIPDPERYLQECPA
jgi:hypothetical protein